MHLAVMLTILVSGATPGRSGETLKVAVMPAKFLKSAANVIEPAAFDEALLAAVQSAGAFNVIGRSDMEAVLGFEKQKDALGCTDTACFAEIGGALGVDQIVEVQVAKADGVCLISAKVIDVKSPLPRVSARVSESGVRASGTALVEALPRVIGKLMRSAQGNENEQPITTQSASGASPSAPGIDVVFDTNLGSFTVRVFEDKAPISAANFLRYVDEGFYDGTIFHRVIGNLMVQGGAFLPNITMKGGTRAPIRNESFNGLSNTRGAVAMARLSGQDTATSGFFVNVTDNRRLDAADPSSQGGYAVFGSVVDGMDVIEQIRAIPTCPGSDPGCSSFVLPPGMRDVPVSRVIVRKARRAKTAARDSRSGARRELNGKDVFIDLGVTRLQHRKERPSHAHHTSTRSSEATATHPPRAKDGLSPDGAAILDGGQARARTHNPTGRR